MDNKSIQHTRWNCTYHIIFIPKYRRKIMYGELKRDLVEILKKLCEMKQVQIIEGKAMFYLQQQECEEYGDSD